MRNLMIPTFSLSLLFLLLTPGAAEAQAQGETVQFRAQVVDVACYTVHDLTGEDHRMCAQVCADQGVSLVFLDDEGRLYHPVGEEMPSSGDEENARLRPHAERHVDVQGTVIDRGGLRTIVIESISEA